MPIELGKALEETMAGWQQQVPAAWSTVVAGVTLNASAPSLKAPHDPWVPIFPTIHDFKDVDRRTLGGPEGAHTFRALQRLRPEDVRVVVIGQDPYPDVAKATGQSFEQGGLLNWIADAEQVATSLRPILQCAAADATGDKSYLVPNAGWRQLIMALEAKTVTLARPRDLFAKYNEQGVLWLNTTFTISQFRSTKNHQQGHADYWRPFVERILGHLTTLATQQPIVFALWGGWAKSFEAPITGAAKTAGNAARVASRASHPVTPDDRGQRSASKTRSRRDPMASVLGDRAAMTRPPHGTRTSTSRRRSQSTTR